MSETLTEFLLARIGEDEEVARACVSHVGMATYDHGPAGKQVYDAADWFAVDASVAGAHLTLCVGKPDENESVTTAANHVSNWNTARVLAECDAKRRIVERYRQFADREYQAETLRLLALPYADHPDYQPEWRP